MEERREWIKKEAKEEQKRRMDEQVNSVRAKLDKWANTVVVGGFYQKEQEVERNEGDVWEDSEGRRWTIRNGVKQTISKMEQFRMPWWCPKCGRPLNHRLHEKFYRIRGACHDCVVVYEGKMRIDGVWDAYERRTMRNNERAWVFDKIKEELESITNFKTPQLHFQDGRWEELVPRSMFEEMFENVRKDIQLLKDRLVQIGKEEDEDHVDQRKLVEWEQKNPWE